MDIVFIIGIRVHSSYAMDPPFNFGDINPVPSMHSWEGNPTVSKARSQTQYARPARKLECMSLIFTLN